MRGKFFQSVEIQVTTENCKTNNVNIHFPQQDQLQSYRVSGQQVFIHSVECFSSSAIRNSPLSIYPTASPFDITNTTVTFVENSKQLRKQIPLARLNHTFSTAPGFVAPFQDPVVWEDMFEVSWTECFITVQTLPPVLPFAYVFGVWYSYEPQEY